MLTDGKVIGFVPTTDPVRARAFYEKQLCLTFVSEDAFALMFDANGTMIRVACVATYTPAPFTILGWNVKNIRECAMQLQRNGIEFQRFPGMDQDDAGVWTAPGGARVAWFRDPDGNMLSISEG